MVLKYLAIYLIFINIIAIAVCVIDKIKAIRDAWRIPEKTLFLISFIGGAVGMYIAMITIRHKTKHKKFMIGIPFIILLQFVALVLILQRIT